MKAEPLAGLNLHAGADGRRAQMIGDEDESGKGNAAAGLN